MTVYVCGHGHENQTLGPCLRCRNPTAPQGEDPPPVTYGPTGPAYVPNDGLEYGPHGVIGTAKRERRHPLRRALQELATPVVLVALVFVAIAVVILFIDIASEPDAPVVGNAPLTSTTLP